MTVELKFQKLYLAKTLKLHLQVAKHWIIRSYQQWLPCKHYAHFKLGTLNRYLKTCMIGKFFFDYLFSLYTNFIMRWKRMKWKLCAQFYSLEKLVSIMLFGKPKADPNATVAKNALPGTVPGSTPPVLLAATRGYYKV